MRDLFAAELATLDGLRDELPELVDRSGQTFGRYEELDQRYERGLDRLTKMLADGGDELRREFSPLVQDAIDWRLNLERFRLSRMATIGASSTTPPEPEREPERERGPNIVGYAGADAPTVVRGFSDDDAATVWRAMNARALPPIVSSRAVARSTTSPRRSSGTRRVRTAAASSHGPPGRPSSDDDPHLGRRLLHALVRLLRGAR
jgi:hypothetical protein